MQITYLCSAFTFVPPMSTVANWPFPVVGPWTWNDMADDVTSAESLSSFPLRLKTPNSFSDYFLDCTLSSL